MRTAHYWNNLYQIRLMRTAHYWNNLYQIRLMRTAHYWNNLYQIRSKVKRLKSQIAKSLWEQKSKGHKQDSHNW
jgi:hypothetical protein